MQQNCLACTSFDSYLNKCARCECETVIMAQYYIFLTISPSLFSPFGAWKALLMLLCSVLFFIQSCPFCLVKCWKKTAQKLARFLLAVVLCCSAVALSPASCHPTWEPMSHSTGNCFGTQFHSCWYPVSFLPPNCDDEFLPHLFFCESSNVFYTGVFQLWGYRTRFR